MGADIGAVDEVGADIGAVDEVGADIGAVEEVGADIGAADEVGADIGAVDCRLAYRTGCGEEDAAAPTGELAVNTAGENAADDLMVLR